MAAMQGFTWDQWKELERQATIYKYMVASLPIPPHLILPLLNPATTTPTPTPTPFDGSTSTLSSSIFELRSSRDKDPEPGRCKRTDGKKWRCSRDVAPHHKYCERHMNRGRSRSRKPVEHKIKQNAPLPNNSTPTPTSGLDWTMETQMLTREHQRQHFMPSIYNSSSSVSQSSYGGDPLSYMDFGNSNHFQDNEDYNLLMNPNMGSLLNPRSFIDAWSNDKPYADNVSPHGNLSPSSLNLSMTMAVGNEDMGIIDDVETPNPSQGSSWSSPVSWVGSTAGGPLGEALLSTYAGSPPATAVSSPSGVVHKNVLSRSDSSVCNSPTLAASNATPETVFFQWIG